MANIKDGKFSKVEIDGRLMIVTLNRPEVFNALHHMAHEELTAVWDEFQDNPVPATGKIANQPLASNFG